MAREQLGVAPAAPVDAATVGYVDGGVSAATSAAIDAADIPGQVATEVSAQDIPGQVATEVSAQDIPGQVADAVAADGTVISAAAAAATTAVDAAVIEADLVSGSDARVPREGQPDVFRIVDRGGYAAVTVTSGGDMEIGSTTVKPTTRWYDGLRIYDAEDRLAFEVRPDGTVFVGEFADDSAGQPISTVHVLIAAGQSNMAGNAFPTDAEIDPPHPRIFQFGANASAITTATVPLDMVDTDPAGISPITFIAREYLQRIGPDDAVLIIPAAHGGSQLNSSTATNAAGIWNAAYTGASLDLYGMLKSQLDSALAAIAVKWPGATTKVVGMFWHQGEANLGTAFADYNTWFDAIVADLRSHLSDSDLPVVLGGLVPEYSPGYDDPRDSHIDTPKRVVRTGFAEGVANGGGYDTNLKHYAREGCAELGRRMLAAYDRALLNTTSSEPHPPLTVSATLVGGVLTVNWSQPLCRYTAFVVEYSDNGGAWTGITHSDVSTTATQSGLTGPVQVRVSTTNDVGTSAATTPVYAVYGG